MTQENKKIIQMIIVDADGEIITAANGRVSSDNPELVRTVKEQAAIGMEIQFIQPFGDYFRASLNPEDLMGITAALFSAKPGRTRLLEAPDEVWSQWESEQAVGGCGHTFDPDGDDFGSMTWEERELALARELFGDLKEENPQGENE